MNPLFAIPFLLAVTAFFIVDEGGSLFQVITRRVVVLDDRSNVRGRLQELGKSNPIHYENFRIFQLSATLAPLTFFVALFSLGVLRLSSLVLLLFVTPVIAVVATDKSLTQRVKKKRAAIESEFPPIVEMLTLAIGSGESATTAIRRISLRADGYLARDFAGVIERVESGVPFHVALDYLSRTIDSVAMRRFVDALIISISRGAPLVETLSHSAKEARSSERIKLLEAAGKSEISMMIPVVFLILPISIIFALFPSLASLDLFSN